MDCSSSDGGHQEVQAQHDLDLTQLTNKVEELIDRQLNYECSMKLSLMHQCSFYLDVQREVLHPVEEHLDPFLMSDSIMWSLIDHQRLARALSMAQTQVKLLLTMLELLTHQLFKSYNQLSAFMEKHRQGLLGRDEAASAQQAVERTLQYAADFDSRVLRIPGPLNLRVKLIPNTRDRPFPRLILSLMMKLPVIIDRSASSVTSSSVHLFWFISGVEDQTPNEQFEVQVTSLHPTIGEGNFHTSITNQLNLEVDNLTPDRYYQLSVKRGAAVNLVWGSWTDSIIMKTLEVKRPEVKV